MNYEIITTWFFEKDSKALLKKYPSLKKEIGSLISSLENNPFQGTPLGRDCFKVRLKISSKGKGKRGGGRILTCVKIMASSVYLLKIYDKGQTDSIDDKELDAILRSLGLI